MWFHFLLMTVPGWWNSQGKASSEQVFGNMLTLAYATEIHEKVAEKNDTTLLNGMAEAFARKAWAADLDFYGYIGSRHSLYNRMVDTLWQGHTWNDDGTWSGGSFTPKGLRAGFVSMMSKGMYPRFNLLKQYGLSILTNQTWHRFDKNRPWDWGNVQSYNPKWFKAWINWNAPMLADPGGRTISNKAQAIWYAWPRPESEPNPNDRAAWLRVDTEYILTKAQMDEQGLCNYPHGCVEMPSNAERPPYIPDYH